MEKALEIDRGEEYAALAVFTALAPLAVGGLVGLLVISDHRADLGIDRAAAIVFATGFLALIVSFLHLGRPWRAPLALRRLASSWLSREVLLFGLFLMGLAAYAFLPGMNLGKVGLNLIGISSAIIGLGGTIVTGETYHLHARPAWDQWLAVAAFPLGALSAGILFGFFAARQFAGRVSVVAGYAWIGPALFLVLALVGSMLRSTRNHPASPEGQRSRQLVLGSSLWLLIVRVAAGVVALVLIGMGGTAQYLAWIPALLGELADRVLFFKTVVPVSLRNRYL